LIQLSSVAPVQISAPALATALVAAWAVCLPECHSGAKLIKPALPPSDWPAFAPLRADQRHLFPPNRSGEESRHVLNLLPWDLPNGHNLGWNWANPRNLAKAGSRIVGTIKCELPQPWIAFQKL